MAARLATALAAAGAALSVLLFSGPVAALELQRHEVLTERERPEVCFTFDRPLAERRHELGDFLRSEPAAGEVSARGDSLCVGGFDHGERYEVTLRTGLPAADGSVLDRNLRLDIYVPDRTPSLSFAQRGYVLPRGLGEGVPLTSVNLARAELTVLRISDRSLTQQIRQGVLDRGLSGWDLEYLADYDAVKVWEGSVRLPDERNKPAVTLLPLLAEIGPLQPGIYAVVAEAEETRQERWQTRATQWFLVSDTGLAAFAAADGLLVQALSLTDGAPLEGVSLSLVSRANLVLGDATTDAEGLARLPAGLLRGQGGEAPALLTAERGEGDFTFLSLAESGIDLLEFGGGGRALPGPLDAWLYTERGIYRPGESVEVLALLRDDGAEAVTGLPLTLRVRRPDGQIFDNVTASDSLGGYAFSLPLPITAPGGTWSLSLHAGEGQTAIGRGEILVADFVPPQIEATLDSPAGRVALDAPTPLSVQADWLYGAPAAGLNGEAWLQLGPVEEPFPDYPDFSFGLTQEEVPAERSTPVAFETDAAGAAEVWLQPEGLPEATRPLQAEMVATVYDLAGRPLTERLALPLDSHPFFLGLRPAAGEVPEGSSAAVEVIALDAEGRRVSREGLRWELLYEEWDYIWYQSGGRWYAEAVVRDRRVDGGALEVPADAPARIEAPLDWGRYRVEVFDPEGPVASSVRVYAGYWIDPSAPERADAVTVSLDRESYRPGETARVFVDPPYDAEVLLLVADREIREHRRISVPEEGAFVDLPVSEDWEVGVHLLVNAYATAETLGGPLPRRAVGLAWLALDPALASLDLALEAPEEARPREAMTVTLALDGLAEGEEAFVALSVVDEGVLQLTDHAEPDPLGWYHGRRQIAVTQNDLYGRLIDPSGDRIGRLASGGDSELGSGLANLPDRSTEILAFLEGPLAVGADGRVEIELPLPDFAGRVRIDAVAWSAGRLAAASHRTFVRDPVVAQLTLPRFLAPGDEAMVRLGLANLSGPAGDYRLRLETEGPLSLDRSEAAAGLAAGAEHRESLTLAATGVGRGTIRLLLEGPDGLRLQRERQISVRPAQPTVSRRQFVRLQAGEAVTLDETLYAGLLPETRRGAVSLGPLPQFDVPGLLAALDRFPYGCVEQITSRALPLVYLGPVAERFGLADSDEAVRGRIQEAVYRLLAMQRPDGRFGLWGPGSEGEIWLTAYALDFLSRAAAAGLHVPESPLAQAYEQLQNQLRYGSSRERDLAGQAYALYLLAREGGSELSELRYFYETRWNELPSRLARAQLVAALALSGERSRADAGLARLGEAAGRRLDRFYDYASPLRDAAAELTLLLEAGLLDAAETSERLEALAADYEGANWLSTQEMAWTLLAVHAALETAEGATVAAIDGERREILGGSLRLPLPLRGETLLQVGNQGAGPLWLEATASGVPAEPLPAERDGMRMRRLFYDLQGEPLNLDAVRQNDLFVMLLETVVEKPARHRALLVQLLPAGWELENLPLNAGGEVEAYPWLGELSRPEQAEYRDDRFVAAVDLEPRSPTARVAFLVRAVTPGAFALPGAQVESMYQPTLFARQAPGRVNVLER